MKVFFTLITLVLVFATVTGAEYISGVTAVSNHPHFVDNPYENMVNDSFWVDGTHQANSYGGGMYMSSGYYMFTSPDQFGNDLPHYHDGTDWLVFDLYLEFDLGGTYDLNEIHIWNGGQTVHPERNMRKVDIAVSSNGGASYRIVDTVILNNTFELYPNLSGSEYFNITDIIDMDSVTADHVRIIAYPDYEGGSYRMDSTPNEPWDGATFYQLSEVKFTGTKTLMSITPADGETVGPDTMLWWTDFGADAYDVYIDVDRQAVEQATDPDVYPGRGRHYAAKCNPLFLEQGQTYYWRVDLVEDGTTSPGPVWKFKVGTYIDPSHITASALSTYSSSYPSKTIDNSGMQGPLHENSGHGANMWMSSGGSANEWIQYDFDEVYQFDKLYIWNYSQFPCCPGRSIKNTTFYLYNNSWIEIGDFTLTQPPGDDLFEATDVIDMMGQAGNKIRISSWPVSQGGSYGENHRGLAEVRFSTAKPKAHHPVFVINGQNCTVSWSAGDGVSSHQFYFGTDYTSVENAEVSSAEYLGSSSQPEFSIPVQDSEITYYCRVDEAGDFGVVKGDIWQLDMDFKAIYYVSPDGSDTNNGGFTTPFATVEKARDAVIELFATRVLPRQEIIVYLRGGKYFRSAPLEFTGDNSGTKFTPVVYRAYPGEQPRIIGGKMLDETWFSPVTSDSPVWARLDSAARGNLLQADLAAHGITDYGIFRDGQGYGRGLVSHMELFFNQQRMELGRWPNAASPGTSDYINGNDFAQVAGQLSDTAFYYSGDRPQRWISAPDMLVTGYWQWAWADRYLKVTGINTSNKIIHVDWGTGFGSNTPQADNPWYALNLLEEIDIPGEWYMDRSSGILYFWPPEPLADSEILVSMLGEQGAGTDGLGEAIIEMEDTSYITLDGLVIECCRYDGVSIRGGHHNEVKNCTIRNTGSVGVYIDGGHHNGVKGSHLHDLSNRAVALSGGDRYTLTHCYNYARNNYIHDFSVWCRTYSPAVQVCGDGCVVSNNIIHSAAHSAIMGGGWYRQLERVTNSIYEYNEIYDVCRDADDSGATSWAWGWDNQGQIFRYNFVHDIHSRWGQWNDREHGVHGSYQDGNNSSIHYLANIWYDIDNRGLMINGGRDNIVDNNIFAKVGHVPLRTLPACGAIASNRSGISGIEETPGSAMNHLERLMKFNHLTPPWSKAFPNIKAIPDSYEVPEYSQAKEPEGNKLYRTLGYDNGLFTEDGPWPGDVFDMFWDIADNIEDQDPQFVDEANLNMNLQPWSPAYSIPGWQDIPFDEIGTVPSEPIVQLRWTVEGLSVTGRIEPFCSIYQARITETGLDISTYLRKLTNGSIKGITPSDLLSSQAVTVEITSLDPQQDVSSPGFSNTVGSSPADVTIDGKVDLEDMLIFVYEWLEHDNICIAPEMMDFNSDCKLNFEDFSIFSELWYYQGN